MENNKFDEIMDVIEFEEKPLGDVKDAGEQPEKEELRIYVPPKDKRKGCRFIIRLIFMTAIFTVVFWCLSTLMGKQNGESVDEGKSLISSADITDETSESEPADHISVSYVPSVVIDESKIGIELNEMNEEYSLKYLIDTSDGVKILIVHTHNSESVSDTLSVTDAGSAISQILTSAGIQTVHCTAEHDKDGNIGAYLRMKDSVIELLEEYPEVVCVIDLHDSDCGLPITFTVGTDGDGWRENLRLAKAVGDEIFGTETAYRFLPGTLGQDSGILTLNVGIGGNGLSDSEARKVISAFAEAFIKICSEKASAS